MADPEAVTVVALTVALALVFGDSPPRGDVPVRCAACGQGLTRICLGALFSLIFLGALLSLMCMLMPCSSVLFSA